jgi:probable rRNA maturation factor
VSIVVQDADIDMRSRPGTNGARPMVPPAQRRPKIEIVVQSALWNARQNAKPALRRVLARAAAVTATRAGELAVVLTSDAEMRRLNSRWRGKDAPTNVLSFPFINAKPEEQSSRLLGDIVIAYETCEREARAQQRSFTNHLAHLAVHGFLHLVGYDHVTADEANRMEALEVAVLARLRIANPYATSDATARA